MTSLFLLGPRAAVVIWWLLQPVRWQTAFHNVLIWPVLGLIFLPWTTLAYVFAVPTVPVTGSVAWGIVLLGFILDLLGYAGGYGNRDQAARYAR